MTDVTDDMDDIVRDFVFESYEGLEQFERDLIALEKDPGSAELLSRIFRTVHTVKGTCGFLPFRRLECVAHAGESLLTSLRRGDVPVDATVTDALLELGDAIRSFLVSIESTGTEGEEHFGELIGRLQVLQAAAPSAPAPSDPRPSGPDRSRHAAKAVAAEPTEPRSTTGEAKIRVDVSLLDSMMNLVGELVLTRNQLAQRAAGVDDNDLRHLSHRLRLITTDLQEGVMQARMQCIDTVWNKLPRVVRDLAAQLGKSVHLDMDGAGTELDRTILEAIKDPMTHIVRNAVDHGLEHPDRRTAVGKPATGTLSLRAFHQGGLVHIEISDDGAGMDPAELRRVATARGTVSAEHAARLSDREALGLIFRPGFSTATAVSNVSGRGVGMDVVKTNIERIGGVVDVESVPGERTTFRIKIPLTLAIIPALVVRTADQRFAIPQPSVQELVRLAGSESAARIERAHEAPVYRLRGELLPLVDLREQLELPTSGSAAGTIVVLHAEGRTVGLVVDTVAGTEDVVVKPLGTQLRDIALYAGAATMGDGGVALILDVAALAKRAGIDPSSTTRVGVDEAGLATEAEDGLASTQPGRLRLLLVELGDGSHAAMPLSAVRRLEKIPRGSVDRVGTSRVVNYRAGLLPLVHPGESFGAVDGPVAYDDHLTVIVCRIEDVTVGLVVNRIVDIVDGEPLLTGLGSRHGAPAAAPVVVDDHLTSLLDLDDVLLGVDPQLLTLTTSAEALR